MEGRYNDCITRFLGPDIINHPVVQSSIVTADERENMDRPLTLEELDESLNNCNAKSAPGMDGFSNKLIKLCWKYLRLPLLNYANHCFLTGTLTQSFRTASIRLIPKKGDISKLKNWRPISLLSNMYKIISRAINARLSKNINRICSRAQKGYNDKRYVQEVLINVCETINYCQNNDIKGSVLAIDMAKAFDTLDHDFIDEVYKFFGLGENICRWLRLCGTGRAACIILDDNNISRIFELGCGRPQGDNISPTTFNFCVQILIFKLELSVSISRIPRNALQIINPCPPFVAECNRETDTNESLADDNTVLSVVEKDSIVSIRVDLNDFYIISGLKCNYDKTMLMPTYDISQAERRMIEEQGFLIVDKITLLGAEVFRNLNEISNNFIKVRDKIISLISYWERFRLSLPGRISIAKTYLVSQINYLGCILHISDELLNDIQQLINNFVRKNLRISEERMHADPGKGGLGMFKLNEFLDAQKVAWIFRAKKLTIDNWRYDIAAKSPNNDPLFFRHDDADRNSPILRGIGHSYERFYEKFTLHNNNYKESYIFRNGAFGNIKIDEQFFGKNFFEAHRIRIRTLKFSDCFIDNVFRTPDEFRMIDLPISVATWMRLRNILLSARTILQDPDPHSRCTTLHEFVARWKKGSKKIRRYFELSRNNLITLTDSRCFITFRTLVGMGPTCTGLMGLWTSLWNIHCIPNDLRQFIFNCRYNCLPLNNRLHSYMREIDPRCTFCRIIDSGTRQEDSFIHCFFHCNTTRLLLKFIADSINIGIDVFNENIYWYGIYDETTDLEQKKYILINLMFDIFRFTVFKHRLRRNIPNREHLLAEFVNYHKILFKVSRSLQSTASNWHIMAGLLQAIG
jgi:Reverse transcriptase (RNA-dependent DNA polymerase)